MAEAGCTYSMQFQARVLQANTCEPSKSQWLVGTTSLRNENEVRLLEYDAEAEGVRSVCSYTHAEEIWDLACCPAAEGRLLTVHSKVGVYGATLWRMSGDCLHALTQLPHEGVVRRVLWPRRMGEVVVSIEEGKLHKWQLDGSRAQHIAAAAPRELQQLWNGSLHPSHPGRAATAAGNAIQVWDLQNMARVGEVATAHRMPARVVDWAPNNEHRLVSAGDDCKLRFWDTRMLAAPEALLELGGHSHWVWAARYSPFHDSLVASGSSDATVGLWYTPQLARRGDPRDAKAAAAPAIRGEVDGRVHVYDEHEDSVYGLAWSAADPWACASLSYDGRVVVNKVPRGVKYKVLV